MGHCTESIPSRLTPRRINGYTVSDRSGEAAFPQALGIFEPLEGEEQLSAAGVFPGMAALRKDWEGRVRPVLASAGLDVPSGAAPDFGGRRQSHTSHLNQLVDDLQKVYRSVPGGTW